MRTLLRPYRSTLRALRAQRARYARAYFSARASEFVGRKLAGRGARARGIPGLFVLQQGYRQADMKKRHLNPPSAELLQVVTSCNNLYQAQIASCYKLLQVVTSCTWTPCQVVTSCYKLLQVVTTCSRSIASCYKLLQIITTCNNLASRAEGGRRRELLQVVTSCYKL